MTPTFNPRKNFLSISLTESIIFLRSVDVSAHRPTTCQNASPSILRGLLILTLVRPTRICNIQVELVGQSITTWTEGQSTRYPSELKEKINLFSATRTFFQAPSIPTGRRALSLEPGLSHYADEAEFLNRRRPFSSIARDSSHLHQFNPVDIPRGRESARARISADEYTLQREPPQVPSPSTPGLSSPSPASSEDGDSVPPLNPPVDRLHAHPPITSSRSTFERRSPTTSPPSMIDLPYESRSLSRNSPSISHLSLPANSSQHSPQPSSLSREGRRASFDDQSLERQRSTSRGRVRSRFSFASVSSSILEAMRSVQGMSSERGHSRQREESRDNEHSRPPPTRRLSHVEEAVVIDGNEHCPESSGDGWQEFKKGTYTFPISFAIPSHVPPTMQCNYGSVSWRLQARVHRPGAFTPKLSASHEVILVASPSEDNRDDTDYATIERFWEGQMQYMLSVSGRVFPIGGTVPITLSLLPLAKVKVFKILVQLEERVDYFFAFSPTARRKDLDRRIELLSLRSNDEDTPILPLPQTVTPATESTLHSLLRSHDDLSEFMSSLMGPGPWTLQMDLTVPDTHGTLHFSNKNKRAPIEITHTLKVVVRVQRSDEQEVDPHTGKLKKYDIVMRTPVHMLSPLSNAQHTALPRYSESFRAPSPLAAPCASSEDHGGPRRHARRSVILQSQMATGVFRPFAVPEEQPVEVDGFYERNVIFERLITGQQREDGILPPAYCAAS